MQRLLLLHLSSVCILSSADKDSGVHHDHADHERVLEDDDHHEHEKQEHHEHKHDEHHEHKHEEHHEHEHDEHEHKDDAHVGHNHKGHDHEEDHAKHDHGEDHAKHDHAKHDHHGHDHAKHDHHRHDHAKHDHHGHDHHGHGHGHHGHDHDHDHGGWHGLMHSIMDMCPWLMLGMFITAVMQSLVPPGLLEASLGGRGYAAVARAATIGLCAPLCSCGALPFALFLGDSGRSSSAVVVAFLTAAQACGIDSFLLTYGLLGSREAAGRVVCSWILAIVAGLAVASFSWGEKEPQAGCKANGEQKRLSLAQSIKKVFTTDFDEVFLWVMLGIVLTTLLTAFDVSWLTDSILSRLMVAFGTLPLQLCEHSAVTFTHGMKQAGATKGMAFAFLVCTPSTNFATLGLFQRRMGNVGCGCLAFAIGFFALILGLVVDASGVQLSGDGDAPSELPEWLQRAGTALTLLLALGTAYRAVFSSRKHVHTH